VAVWGGWIEVFRECVTIDDGWQGSQRVRQQRASFSRAKTLEHAPTCLHKPGDKPQTRPGLKASSSDEQSCLKSESNRRDH
jgi:hypothetical protein